MKKTIRVKISTIMEARAEAYARIPQGFKLLNEEIQFEGIRYHLAVNAATREDAMKMAPAGMSALGVLEVEDTVSQMIWVHSKDWDSAQAAAAEIALKIFGPEGAVLGVKLSKNKKQSMLGIGAKNLYQAVIAKFGKFQLEYAKNAELVLTVTNRESEPDFSQLLKALDVTALIDLLEDQEPKIRTEAFRSLNSLLSTNQLGLEAKENIMIALRKASTNMSDDFMMSMVQEDLNKSLAVNFLADTADASTLSTLIKQIGNLSMYSEVVCKLIKQYGTQGLEPMLKDQFVKNLTSTALHVGTIPHEALGATQILLALKPQGLIQTLGEIALKKDYTYNMDGEEFILSYEDQRKLARTALRKIRTASLPE